MQIEGFLTFEQAKASEHQNPKPLELRKVIFDD